MPVGAGGNLGQYAPVNQLADLLFRPLGKFSHGAVALSGRDDERRRDSASHHGVVPYGTR